MRRMHIIINAMKKILFFCFLFVVARHVFSQTVFNKAYHDRRESTSAFLTVINNDYYFTTLGAEVNNWSNCYLYRHDKNGILKSKIIFSDSLVPARSFKTLDNKLFIAGKYTECDVGGEFEFHSIVKLDTNGTVIFYANFISPVFDFI